jgi:hypothetical protein
MGTELYFFMTNNRVQKLWSTQFAQLSKTRTVIYPLIFVQNIIFFNFCTFNYVLTKSSKVIFSGIKTS